MDPDSPVGILQVGMASTSITTATTAAAAAAANIFASSMVGDLPLVVADAKTGTKTHVKKDSAQSRAREAILDNIGQFEHHRDECIRTNDKPDKKCLDGIARGYKALADHDKLHAVDTSAKTIAELAGRFAEIDAKVKNVDARLLQGVAGLSHEITTRSLQLEKMVEEKNALLADRRKARALCNESTTRNHAAAPHDMEAVVEFLKKKNIPGLSDDLLKKIVESESTDPDGFTAA